MNNKKKSNLNWKNLAEYKCPKCEKAMGEQGKLHKCSNTFCTFVITNDRLKELLPKISVQYD